MRKFLYVGVFAIFALMIMQVQALAGPSGLSDISGHWAKTAIENAVAKGYVAGYPDGSFKPNAQVTRAEFIKMVVDALKLPHSQGGTPWYQPYVAAAMEMGIHQEKDFNTDWNKPLTRMEMARISVRATDPELQKPNVLMDDKSFMYRATQTGIIQGMGNGELAPEGLSTRAQAVAIVERILTVNSGGKLPVDDQAIENAKISMTGTNIFKFGLKLVQPLPISGDSGDLKYTMHELFLYPADSKEAQEIRNKYSVFGSRYKTYSHFAWIKVTLENTGDKEMSAYNIRDTYGKYGIQFGSNHPDIDPERSKEIQYRDDNDKEILYSWTLQPKESITSYQAYLIEDGTSMDSIKLYFMTGDRSIIKFADKE